MRNKLPPLLLAFAALWFSVHSWRESASPTPELTPVPSEQEVQSTPAMTQQPSALRATRPAQKTPHALSGANLPPGGKAPAVRRTRPDPLDPADLEARAAEAKMLTDRWQGQERDPTWSRNAEMTFTELLAQADFQPDVVHDVDCRKTICRFTLSGADGADAVDLLHIARQVHDETWLDHNELADGTWNIEVFFSRAGFRLSGDGGPIASRE